MFNTDKRLPEHFLPTNVFDFPGFRVALAIASLPGMTPKLFNKLREHHTSLAINILPNLLPPDTPAGS